MPAQYASEKFLPVGLSSLFFSSLRHYFISMRLFIGAAVQEDIDDSSVELRWITHVGRLGE